MPEAMEKPSSLRGAVSKRPGAMSIARGPYYAKAYPAV